MTLSLNTSPEPHTAFLHLGLHLNFPEVLKCNISKNKLTILDSKPIILPTPYQLMAPVSHPGQSQERHPLLFLSPGLQTQSVTYY